MNSSTLTVVGGIVLSACVIGAVTALAWHGTINGEATVGIFATIISAAVSVFAHKAGADSVTAAAAPPVP